ncbi:histidine kinase N-terminal 7TM domain-containing protein [Papillibacter cinnamivorans]|uniref:N-terminal 7TM region of histidine kinase n=1 Tax=Papillibacter cinnamivorans DSM 12816 TaxID=1122930 RepID=A0A1W2ATI7_9FIRM|nr:histidine kinase N-terminal 7TM domain-containing protein [Papillibacter cinnamivorans]SMC63518.1 N-terminal 7TM region of histidine kinase [Papillibacter cinnamivorans DSM 12816]
MKRLTIFAAVLFLSLAAFTAFSLTGLLPQNTPRTAALLNDQAPEPYNRLIMRELDGFTVKYHFNKYMLHLIGSSIAYVQAEDARVLPRLDEGMPGRFFPHYISTVVFLMPENMEPIRSFAELYASPCRFFVTRKHMARVLPAMALALNGGASLDEAVSLLALLQEEGRLIVGETTGEFESVMDGRTVALVPDDEGARLILSGLPVMMHVPSDGTYSFTVGLFAPSDSAAEIVFTSDELVEAGLRTTDGRTLPGLYPDASEYLAAVKALGDPDYMLLAHDTVPAYRRGVMGTHLFSTADGSERVALYIPLAILIVFWGVSLSWRVVDRGLRRLLQTQTALLLLWLLIVLLKQSADTDLTRFLWYLYYLPLIGSAAVLALTSIHIGGIIPEHWKKVRTAILVPSGLIVLMVMTNDLHQFVFRFTSELLPAESYEYQPGFFLLFAWVAFLALGGLMILYRCAGNRRNGRYIVLLSGLVGSIALYNILYIAGVSFIRQTQMGPVHVVFILLLWELTLRSGLIPYNRYYRLLFESSRLSLYLVRHDGSVHSDSSGAEPLPPDITAGITGGRRLFFAPDDPGGALGPDYEAAEISGGFVVWKHDLSGIRSLNKNLRRIRQSLLGQTALLEKQVEQERVSQALSARRHMLERLDGLVRPRLDEVGRLAERLSPSLSEAEFRSVLRDIISLIGYCKRIGLLHLGALPDGSVPARLVTLLLQEICADSAEDKMEIALYGEPSGAISLREAIGYLDFCRDLFSVLRDCASGSIFVHADDPDGALALGFLCDLPAESLEDLRAFAENRRSVLAKGSLTLNVIFEDPSLRLVLRKEGKPVD